MIMFLAAFIAEPAPPAATVTAPSDQQRAYAEWGECLENRLAPDRFMTAPRITDRAMQACLRYELIYSEAQRRWAAAANLNEAQRQEADRAFNRNVRRMRRMIEEEAQEIQDQSGNR